MAIDASKIIKKETAIDHLTWNSTAGWVGPQISSYDHLLNQDVGAKHGPPIPIQEAQN